MTRRVVTNDMVAHLWAHQMQDDARGHGGNFYFRGDYLYSYSACIGQHVTIRTKGHRPRHAVLVSSNYRSVTTRMHKDKALRAVPTGLPVIQLPYLGCDHGRAVPDHDQNKRYFLRQVVYWEGRIKTSRTLGRWYLENLSRLTVSYDAYSKLFGLRWASIELSEDLLDKVDQINRGQAEDDKRDAERRAVRAAELVGEIADWHGCSKFARLPYDAPTCLRVRWGLTRDLDVVETSMGVRIPVTQAPGIYQALRALRIRAARTGAPAFGGGLRVAGFAVDYVAVDGVVRAGCHLIAWAEIERVAVALGLSTNGGVR